MDKKLLFNPNGDDTEKRLIKGNTTNVFDLYNVKYKWAKKSYDDMMANHWIPEKASMMNDKQSFNQLTETEKEAYLKILSFLIFLDSIQTNNIPNIADYITAPEVVVALAIQTKEEAIHSKSYGHIMTSIFDKETAEKSIYYWRDVKILLERNSYIAKIYQDFSDNSTDENFVRVLIANYLLEGLYFYNGFYFFYNLASRGLMVETSVQIKYINRDELQHCALFVNIINTLREEEPELIKKMEDEIYEMFKIAVEQEITFTLHALGEGILGMNENSVRDYTSYIANRRLKSIKMNEIFPKVKNPYSHLDYMAGVEDETTNKPNVFEVNSTQYKQANAIGGWENI